MENEVKLEYLDVTKSADEFYDCVVTLPWYGSSVDVNVRFDNDDDAAPPTPMQLLALKEFLDNKEEILSELEEQLFTYYKGLREENRGEDYFEECFPEIEVPRKLGQYMRFQSIGVCYYDEDWSSYIGLIIDCDWDIELGVGVKLIKNRVREIGVQDIVL
jgi:hypothetical protein